MFYECEANFGSPAVGDEDKSKTCFRFIEATPGGKTSRSEDLLAPKSPFLCDIINLWRGGPKAANGGKCFLGRKY